MSEEMEKKEEQPEGISEKAVDTQDAEALREALGKEKARAEEYLDQWRRERAEFSNFKKRMDKEREEVVKFANSLLVAKLLPVLDDFDRALATLPPELRDFTWVDGIYLIQRKVQMILEQEGLTAFGQVGEKFDPNLHEAVIHEETDAQSDGHITAVVQKGYRLGDRVLRPALVKVAKNTK